MKAVRHRDAGQPQEMGHSASAGRLKTKRLPIMVNKSPLRVLVVEDEPLLRWSIAESLGAAGHTVIEAQDAAAATRAISDPDLVDVILLDVRLPDNTDLGLLERLRRMTPATPVVMMTAYGNPALATNARRLGASDVLDKPFDIFALPGVLESARQSPPFRPGA